MTDLSISGLALILALLILLSACFSAAETAMMRLNHYRLRHLVKAKHRGALCASRLLERPDRLIGFILIGNNFVNILASSIATLIALRAFGEAGIAAAAGLLTFVLLIFGEVTPKTLAALHPERIAFPAAYVITPLLILFYPFVWIINTISNSLLKLIGVSPDEASSHQLSADELRTVVNEAGALIPRRHQHMLLNILDLEKASIEDIMIPRSEIVGIDLARSEEEIITLLASSRHTRLPVFREDLNEVTGILHVRSALPLIGRGEFSKEALTRITEEPYFIPEGTPLNTQLLNFQRQKRRIGLVVDEYGDIEGLVTLEDILEEIVGEFTTDVSATVKFVHPQGDGSYLVDGSAPIRSLNRMMNWQLPTAGPKTLNGLIIEHLESIPTAGTSLRIDGYTIEIVHIADNAVRTARMMPRSSPARSGTPSQ
jgi:Mg2+/Co2+ transporter CorB